MFTSLAPVVSSEDYEQTKIILTQSYPCSMEIQDGSAKEKRSHLQGGEIRRRTKKEHATAVEERSQPQTKEGQAIVNKPRTSVSPPLKTRALPLRQQGDHLRG
jgi:ribulose bisphosphate carboxylase small subunit